MIRLSNRLEAISTLITEYDTVLDVGCDHALLDIYLSNKYKKRYYATDIKESVIKGAKENLIKYDAYDVDLKVCSGIDGINDSINTIVISGMGYITISYILKNINKYKNVSKIIIQSNTNVSDVRKYMINKGFYIDKELLVLDNKIYYVVTCFKKGKKKHTKMDIEVGMFNSNNMDKYLDIEIKKNNILLNVVPKKYILKRKKIKDYLNLLEMKRNMK